MQQTEKYKLNLIESSDPFLPEGLNENTQKVEDAMLAHEEKVDGQVANLDARVAVFEAKKFAVGSYTGNYEAGKPYVSTIQIGFAPEVIFIHHEGRGISGLFFRSGGDYGIEINFLPDGFSVYGNNINSGRFHYIAFA